MNLYTERYIDLYNYCSENNPICNKTKSQLQPGDLCVRKSDRVVYKLESIISQEDDYGRSFIYYDFSKFMVAHKIMNDMFLNII